MQYPHPCPPPTLKLKLTIYASNVVVRYGEGLRVCDKKEPYKCKFVGGAFGRWLKFEDDSLSNYCDWNIFLGHPGLDLDVGEFLDSLQLNNLKDIFEKEQARARKYSF